MHYLLLDTVNIYWWWCISFCRVYTKNNIWLKRNVKTYKKNYKK